MKLYDQFEDAFIARKKKQKSKEGLLQAWRLFVILSILGFALYLLAL